MKDKTTPSVNREADATEKHIDESAKKQRRGTRCDICGALLAGIQLADSGIICNDCRRAQRRQNERTLRARIERFGGGQRLDADVSIAELTGDER
jgi:hypothetical protein